MPTYGGFWHRAYLLVCKCRALLVDKPGRVWDRKWLEGAAGVATLWADGAYSQALARPEYNTLSG